MLFGPGIVPGLFLKAVNIGFFTGIEAGK